MSTIQFVLCTLYFVLAHLTDLLTYTVNIGSLANRAACSLYVPHYMCEKCKINGLFFYGAFLVLMTTQSNTNTLQPSGAIWGSVFCPRMYWHAEWGRLQGIELPTFWLVDNPHHLLSHSIQSLVTEKQFYEQVYIKKRFSVMTHSCKSHTATVHCESTRCIALHCGISTREPCMCREHFLHL